MRYLIQIKYDGSKFYGFQRLNNYSTVQKEIEDALKKIFKTNIVIKGAGRTDRGVHAYCQMAHFDSNQEIPSPNIKKALNTLLNKYIYIQNCEIISKNIHARFSVKEKSYLYMIDIGEYDPLKSDYVWNCKYNLDINLMKKCSKVFIGIHDFENFVSGKRENYEAIIYDINFEIVDNIIKIVFKGKSFYRYMVRSLVGCLVDVGRKKITIQDVEDALSKKNNKRFFIAPACGLYLIKITY